MFSARRIYVYVVSLISYAAVVFAAISLLQSLLLPAIPADMTDMALQIAILIVATPIYLGHWFWQQRKIAQDDEERGDLVRRTFLYLLMAGSVTVLATSVYDLMSNAINGERWLDVQFDQTPVQYVVYYLIPIGLAVGTWLYHRHLLGQDQRVYPDNGARGSVSRLYVYAFSAAGLTMVSLATIDTISWLLTQAGGGLLQGDGSSWRFESVIPQIAVGLPLWLAYWIQAQRRFLGDEEEKDSILRKFYLYAAIFIGVVGAVAVMAILLSNVIQRLMGLPTEGSLANVISRVLVFGALWFYHRRVLADDTAVTTSTEQQEEIRRIYWYLLSAIGLGALLIGLVGDISTLLFVIEESMSDVHKLSLSYFTASMIAGLPVWFIAWRKVQQEAAHADSSGARARNSISRRIYLYLYLLLSVITVLGSAIFVVYTLLRWILAGDSVTLTDVAIPLTMAVVGFLVWFYHLTTLRTDRSLAARDEVRQLSDLRLALVTNAESKSLDAVVQRLHRMAPDMNIPIIRLDAEKTSAGVQAQFVDAAGAEVLVGPWSVFLSEDGAKLAMSTAHKVVLPEHSEEWHWVGMETMTAEQTADETLAMLRRITAGEALRTRRRWNFGAIVLSIIGLLLLTYVLLVLIPMLFYGF